MNFILNDTTYKIIHKIVGDFVIDASGDMLNYAVVIKIKKDVSKEDEELLSDYVSSCIPAYIHFEIKKDKKSGIVE